MSPPRRDPTAAAHSDYARLAAGPCPPLGSLCLALSAIFSARRHDGDGDDRLDELGRRLFGASADDGGATARRLAGLLADDPGFVVDDAGPDGMLIDAVLERRCGHPLLLAVAVAEAGRRAGLRTGVFSAPEAWYAGLVASGTLWLVDVAGRHVDPGHGRCRGHCGHELAFAILFGLEHRYSRLGDHERSERARRLRHGLSFDHGTADRATAQGDPLAVLWPR